MTDSTDWHANTRAAIAKYLQVDVCVSCKGKGGFLDSTYDRTGTWCSCNHCGGTGMSFSRVKLNQLMGWKVKKEHE